MLPFVRQILSCFQSGLALSTLMQQGQQLMFCVQAELMAFSFLARSHHAGQRLMIPKHC